MTRTHSLVLALGLTVLAACGESGRDPLGSDPSSTYTAAVTGEITRNLSGAAWFAPDTNAEGDSVFAVALGSPTSDDVLLLVRRGSAIPTTGAYTFVGPLDDTPSSDAWTAVYIMGDGEDLVGLFMAGSGTLTIGKANAQQLKASFQFDGTGFLADDMETELTISVSGSFDAGAASNAVGILSATRATY